MPFTAYSVFNCYSTIVTIYFKKDEALKRTNALDFLQRDKTKDHGKNKNKKATKPQEISLCRSKYLI